MKTTSIILLRHGQSEANRTSTFAGQNETPLSELGFKQAKKVKERLDSEKIDVIYSSPLSRAIETVKPTAQAKGKEIIIDKDFKEIYFGEWEGKTKDYLVKHHPDYLNWRKFTAKYTSSNGEKQKVAGKRFFDRLQSIANENEGKTLLISSHGGIIMAFLCYIGYFDFETATHSCIPHNASITTLEYKDGEFLVKNFSEEDYLSSLASELNLV